MNNASTKQIDAVWIVHDAASKRCYLDSIFDDFKGSIGAGLRGMTTVIITQCDKVMEAGDYLQYPKEGPFEVPAGYGDVDDAEIRNELFWVKIMQPGLPFDFAKNLGLISKPICWTNKPANLFRNAKMPVKKTEETQKKLLEQSLKNSVPFMPYFLQQYEEELTKTANH